MEIMLFTNFLIFCYVIIYKALTQPQVFNRSIEDPGAQKKLTLSEAVKQKYLARLNAFMEDEKPYMDPEISLPELAEKVTIPSRSLSEIINNSIGLNFYDFINSYRVEESKRLLSVPSEKYKTVLEVLYEVGFNSKSTFNNAFKKFTGLTPSEYKKVSRS